MLPTPEQLLKLSLLRQGSLAEVPFALLLRALCEHQRTVVVEVSRRQLTKSIVLELGVPVDCESNLVHERLGRVMVSLQKLTEAEFNSALSESLTEELPLGQILLRRKVVSASELYRILQQTLAKKLLDLFSWSEGEFSIHSELPEVYSPLKVRVHQLILTGLTRFASQQSIDLMVMTLLGKRLMLHPKPPVPPEELRLNVQQRRVIEALRRSPLELSELAGAARLEPGDLWRLVYALGILGMIGDEEILVRVEVAEADPARTMPVIHLPVLDEGTLLSQDELVQLFLEHRRKDPFELLGLSLDAPPAVVEAVFLDRAQRLRPWAYPEEEGQRDRAQDLFLAFARAYTVLADSERRQALVEARAQRRERRKPARPGPRQIRTDLLDPEGQHARGTKLMAEGKTAEAMPFLEFASDCDPQNGTYRADAAYCRYLSDPRHATQALAELAEARRIDSGCGLAYFYAGEILRELERFEEAEAMLQAAIRPMSPDRRPIEALKLLTKVAKQRS